MWLLMSAEPASENQTGKTDYLLLIQPVFRQSGKTRQSRWLRSSIDHPVRGVPFDAGLRVTNISDKPFPGARILDFRIESAASQADAIETEKQVDTKTLNPGESASWWFREQLRLPFEGPISISCALWPKDESIQITTFKGSIGSCTRYAEPNEWSDGEYVEEKFAVLQARTNSLILILTVLTLLEGVVGLRTVFIDLPARLIRELLELVLRVLPQG
jgi:hypothetical protein